MTAHPSASIPQPRPPAAEIMDSEDEEFEESDQEEDQGVGMTQGILGDSDQEAG